MGSSFAARSLSSIGAAGPVAYIGLTIMLGVLWDGYDPIQRASTWLALVWMSVVAMRLFRLAAHH